MDNDFITPEYCSNCGTKTTAEICPNCGASTGITYKDLSLKYPYQEYLLIYMTLQIIIKYFLKLLRKQH